MICCGRCGGFGRGQGLHLQQLSIDGGQVLVDGSVDAISYEDDIPRGGFFARLFG